MVFKFQKILFLEFWVARVSKKRPGSVWVFKNTGTAGQISGRVWTQPNPRFWPLDKSVPELKYVFYHKGHSISMELFLSFQKYIHPLVKLLRPKFLILTKSLLLNVKLEEKKEFRWDWDLNPQIPSSRE